MDLGLVQQSGLYVLMYMNTEQDNPFGAISPGVQATQLVALQESHLQLTFFLTF